MSKQLSSDAIAYDKEYDAFVKQLEDFHQQRGTNFKKLPRINGKTIDLYLLYVVVTARGGWQKVNSRNEWPDLMEDFRLHPACVNSIIALKQVYVRYLDAYERIHYLGEDGNEQNNDGDEDDSRAVRLRKSVRNLNNVPMSYNSQQHVVTESARLSSGLCTDLYKASTYDRLALSLTCPLPNEHDFAFNMCTLLSNEGKHTLQLSQCTRLIELMLAHTGVFKDKYTQKYFISNYKESRGKSLVQFWMDSVEDKSVLDLLNTDCMDVVEQQKTKESQKTETPLITVEPVPGDAATKETGAADSVPTTESTDTRSTDQRGGAEGTPVEDAKGATESKDASALSEEVQIYDVVDLGLKPEDTEIFHLGRDLGLLDSEGTRISQVLHIIRNLSFDEINVSLLAESSTCLRFLVLCVCSRWGGLSIGALDILGNIASELKLHDPAVDPSSALLLTTVCQGVSSQDRAFVLRCLEVLNKLSLNEPNEEILNAHIDQLVFDQICRYLTVHDIMLLIFTLECLYALSSLGEQICNRIARSKGAIKTLISLLTVEAQSYGPDACIGMKVVETVTGVVTESESTEEPTKPVVGTPVPIANQQQAATPVLQAVTPATVTNQQTGHRLLASAVLASTPKTTKPPVEPKRLVTSRVVPQEVEDFAMEWVRRNYECCATNAIEQAIVYRHFSASMHSAGKKLGVNPIFLSGCIKKVFGVTVGPCKRQVDGLEKWHYVGIKRREGVTVSSTAALAAMPTPIVPVQPKIMQSVDALTGSQSVQGSILKAHLSSPLKPISSPVSRIGGQPLSRHMQNQNGPTEVVRVDGGNTFAVNGLSIDGATVENENLPTSFEGILQNGLTKETDCVERLQEQPPTKKNLLADLLEKTVGEDMLNGVVDKEIRLVDRNSRLANLMKQNGPQAAGEFTGSAGLKRPAPQDSALGPAKKMALDDAGKITLYVSQNGTEGEVLAQGHQVILNQGHQLVSSACISGQLVNSQTMVTPQGQVIIQRAMANPTMVQSPIVSAQVAGNKSCVARTILSQSPAVVSSAGGAITSAMGTTQMISSNGQLLQQVVTTTQNQSVGGGPGPQKVILHGGQLGQMIGNHHQVMLPQSNSQGIVLQAAAGNNLPGQLIMPGGSNSVIVQGANGQNQVIYQGASQHGGQVILQASAAHGGQYVMSGGSPAQSPLMVNSAGQAMILANSQGQSVIVGGAPQSGHHQVVMSGGAAVQSHQGQQLLVQQGNSVFLAPHHHQQQTQAGQQKTLIILPNPKMVVGGGQGGQAGQMMLPRQVVQVVSAGGASNSTAGGGDVIPVQQQLSGSMIRVAGKQLTASTTTTAAHTPLSIQVTTGGVAVPPYPKGPVATPVAHAPSAVSPGAPHVPAPQVISSGVACRRPPGGKGELQYVCEWRGCQQPFGSPAQVYHHACKVHCAAHFVEVTCQWTGCEPMTRRRYSAMTHIHDRHCNEQLLQIHALRRQQLSISGKTDIPMPQTPPPHPGYAPNAAFHAIKRHSIEVINQRDAVEKEGPVTKSIRLTAALILRNLVIYSNLGKELLVGYESDLANVAISSMESSRTAGQMLYYMNTPVDS